MKAQLIASITAVISLGTFADYPMQQEQASAEVSVVDQTDYEYVVFSGPVCGTPQLALEYSAPGPTTCQFMQDEPAAIYNIDTDSGVPTMDFIINVEWEGQLLAFHVYGQQDYVEVFYPMPHPFPPDNDDSWDPAADAAPTGQEI